jgi:hypothetical protein
MSRTTQAVVKRVTLLATLAGLAFLLAACGSTSKRSEPARAAAAPQTAWGRLPQAPIKVDAALTGVWADNELIVSGVRAGRDGTFLQPTEVAAAYDPVARAWRRFSAPPRMDGPCGRTSAWTGTEVLVWGCFGKAAALDPQTNRWRSLPQAPTGEGIAVWTGSELIGWGGGCCGDAWSAGSAYDPATGTWRTLARSPLAPSQQPVGAWTGSELVLFVAGKNPDGGPYPASLARAAAYDPRTDTWRRIRPMPAQATGTAVWDGREVLVVGDGRAAFAYDPAADRWRRLAPLPSARFGVTAVWTGKRLLVWGEGRDATASQLRGFALDPAANRWSALPKLPLDGFAPAIAWNGHELLVWPGSGRGAALIPLPERSTR